MTDITIPPEALEAAARKLWLMRKELFGPAFPRKTWEELSDGKRSELLDEARAAIAAAINAWPGMEMEMVHMEEDYLILPLPKESRNG